MDIKKDMAEFIKKNNVIGVTVGLIIGYAVKDAIGSLVIDVFIPLIIIGLSYLKLKQFNKIFPESNLNITKCVGEFITLIFLTIITYFFIQYVFVKILAWI